MTAKVDVKKSNPRYSAKSGRCDVVAVPPMRYLAMNAAGGPAGEDFAASISALYPLAYAIKFASKIVLDRDYVVPPLEAQWWAADMAAFTTAFDKSDWLSTTLLMVPDWITEEVIDAARAKCEAKVGAELIARVRVESIEEATCVQTLHVGSFDAEGPTVAAVHATIADAGLTLAGKHHEIYLSDFRRTATARLRTIVRQPAAPKERAPGGTGAPAPR